MGADISPAAIVAKARDWIGTPFKHQGRLKSRQGRKGGCDCLGLILGVVQEIYSESGVDIICPNKSYISAASSYGRIANGGKLEFALGKYLLPIEEVDISVADILLFKIDGNPQHIGLVSDLPEGALGVIHAYAQARKVVEHHLDEAWFKRIAGAYRFRALGSPCHI